MELWLDTINFETIEFAESMGILDGVTTNPSILAASKMPIADLISTLLAIQKGPITLQVSNASSEKMLDQAEYYSSFSERILIKVPVTQAGLQVLAKLSARDIKTVATAIFYPTQVYLAAKVGATYAAPYLGRMEKTVENSFELLESMLNILENYGYETKILAASLKTAHQAIRCAEMGVHAITLKPNVFKEFVEENAHTQECLDQFQEDWLSCDFSQTALR